MNPDHATSFWITAPGKGELRREPLAVPSEGDVIVQTLFSGISRGTEVLVFNGQVPPSEYQRMRAPFQMGDFPAPVKYGYASVGRVVGGAAPLVGTVVFCLHPHQTRYVVPSAAVHALPPDVPPERAVLAANLETAVNAIWDAAIRPGDRVAVVGGGCVGLLIAWLAARIPGCSVQLVDSNPGRAATAQALGASFAVPARAQEDADIVFHASSTQEGLRTALNLAGNESCVMEVSWYGTRSVNLELGGAFHSRRLTLRSMQVGSVALAQRARWTASRRLAFALTLLRAPELAVLINSEGSFDALPATLARLAQGASDVILHRVTYDTRS